MGSEAEHGHNDIEDYDVTIQFQSNFKGWARVKLSSFDFEKSLHYGHRAKLDTNVNRLRKIFREEGCRRLDDDNFAAGIVNAEGLHEALAASNLHEEDLRQIPTSDTPCLRLEKIDCVHGMHRILAGRHFLRDHDRWWIVCLFTGTRKLYEIILPCY